MPKQACPVAGMWQPDSFLLFLKHMYCVNMLKNKCLNYGTSDCRPPLHMLDCQTSVCISEFARPRGKPVHQSDKWDQLMSPVSFYIVIPATEMTFRLRMSTPPNLSDIFMHQMIGCTQMQRRTCNHVFHGRDWCAFQEETEESDQNNGRALNKHDYELPVSSIARYFSDSVISAAHSGTSCARTKPLLLNDAVTVTTSTHKGTTLKSMYNLTFSGHWKTINSLWGLWHSSYIHTPYNSKIQGTAIEYKRTFSNPM